MSRERITINSLTAPSELAALANDPAVTLDVTDLADLDLGRLPAHVKASLYTEATTFSAPQLQKSGDIDADSATSFSAPQTSTPPARRASARRSFRSGFPPATRHTLKVGRIKSGRCR